ncbi:unnamed protein product [Meloidogyne enterolobii]|uniref:Uncharacterized protein n=3 Tax=Meloidogyne TaxID=189290 RepID=A0ACB0XKZ5_MELEN|nr:unnamed protein product [Meloidogyne enterolobii]
MGLLMYIILVLFFGAIGFGAAEYLRKVKDAGAGKAKGGGAPGAESKSGKKSGSAETAASGGAKKGKKK